VGSPIPETTKKDNIIGTANIPFPQEDLWKETLNLFHNVKDPDELLNSKLLESKLNYNSSETRKRYGSAMATRFARLDRELLFGFVRLIQSGAGTDLIEQIWRVMFCTVEPLVAQVYLDVVWPREPGSSIQRDQIKGYLQTVFAQQSQELNKRVVKCLRHTGYLIPHGKQDLIVVGFGNLEDALILSTHLMLAQNPRTIKISDLEASNYWRFLGYKKFDHVRIGFRRAEAQGLIMRYAVVDHLEQITTRYTWEELIDKMRVQDET
jgi:hypothetical protein